MTGRPATAALRPEDSVLLSLVASETGSLAPSDGSPAASPFATAVIRSTGCWCKLNDLTEPP